MQAISHREFTLSTVASVQAVAARNLQLLQAIENTVNRLGSDTKLLGGIADGFAELMEAVQKSNSDNPLDPQGFVCTSLQNSSDAASRIYARATGARQSACDDKALRPDDGVVEAFDEYLAAVASVHDLIEQIKDWIEIHDAALEPSTGVTYSDVNALFEALGKD